MRITRDSDVLKLSQEDCDKVLSKFNMNDAKSVRTLLTSHFKLSNEHHFTMQERAYMAKLPYASVIGNLMYAMVCTRPDIAHVVRVVNRLQTAFEGGKVDS